MDSKPMRPPRFHNLQISGSWNGEFEGPVRVRISLEVQSAPNTALRLLDTKSLSIFLKTATARLLSDESNDSSSLFSFSSPNSDKMKGARRVSAERPPSSLEAFSASQDGPPLPSFSAMKDIISSRDTSSADLPYSDKFSKLCLNIAEPEDLTDSPPRQKRSAADACFSDPGLSSDDAQTHKRRASSNETEKTIGPFSRTGESIQSSKLLGLEAWLETAAQQNEDGALGEGLADPGSSEPCLEEGSPDKGKNAADEVTGTEIYGQSATVAESSNTPPREAFPAMERPYTRTPEPQSYSTHGQEDSSSGLSASLGLGTGMIEVLDDDAHACPSSPDLSILLSEPKPPHSKSGAEGEDDLFEETEGGDVNDGIQPLIEFSWSDPKLLLSNGFVIVKFSSKARPGTYKIEVDFTTYVDDDYIRGWSTILLPELPHLQEGEIGSFLFRLPDDRGLEFFTTDMQRCQVVGNCFFAEFTSLGYLTVSLRVCGRRFYGYLKDVILDQEIIAHPAVVDSKAEINRSARYCAMCSLVLGPRYICSEKCGLSFYVDGGPDGFFNCKLEHEKAGLQMIEIPNSESDTIGVSRVQVICSPKDLGMFCLVWSDRHRHATPWLPRIYTVSPSHPEGNRDLLRDTLTGLSKRGLFRFTKMDVKQLANEAGDEEEGDISGGKASTETDLSGPDVPELLGVLHFLRLLMSSLKTSVLQFTKGCITTANRVLFRLCLWMCSSMMRLILVFGAAYAFLSMLIWFFLRDASLDVSNSVQGHQVIPLDMCELDAANHTMAENIDAGMSVSFDDDVFKPDQPRISAVETSVVDTEDGTETAKQVPTESTDSDQGDEEANPGDHQPVGFFTLRDRVDYWLGWRGPVNGMV